jgi:tetratricopeptide (TPR) repeat protein
MDKSKFFSEIGSLMTASKFDQALKLAEQASAEFPDDGAVHQQYAELLFLFKDFSKAIVEYRIALNQGMDNAHMHKNLGIALSAQGDHQSAINQFKRAAELDDKDYTASLNLANTYLLAEDYKSAEEVFKRLTGDFPRSAEVYYQYGLFLGQLARYREAITVYNQAIKHNKKDARYLLSRGGAYASLSKLPQAKEDFERSCQLFSENPLGFNNLGYCYFLDKAYQKAIPLFQRAIQLDGDYYQAYQNLGAALALSGDEAGAEKIFRQSIEVDPSKPEGYHNLGYILQQLGKMEEAIAILQKGAELGDENSRELLRQIQEKQE